MFKPGDEFHKIFVFIVGAKTHHRFNHGPVVPTPVEQHDLAAGRQVGHVALEVPLAFLTIGGLAKGYDAGDPGIEVLCDPLDHPAFPGSVPSTSSPTSGPGGRCSFIASENARLNGGLARLAFKMATGSGKTTLLKLLAGALNPQNGEIQYNPSIKKGFFEQTNIQTLVDSNTVEDEILYTHAETDRPLARSICGAMMFSGDDALKKISVLSGGEKSRVMLGKLLIRPLNLLLLDEPSNHLDIEASDAFVEALNAFEGAVVLVTHNEMFLHALANRLVIFTSSGIDIFEGTYQEFLEKQGWEDEELIPIKRKKKATPGRNSARNSPRPRCNRS